MKFVSSGTLSGQRTNTVMNESGLFVLRQRKVKALATVAVLLLCLGGAAQQPQEEQSAHSSPEFRAAEKLAQQGHLDEAKQALLEQMKQTPESVEGYNLLGIIESEQKDFSGALEAFQKALTLAPENTKTHNNLGNFYLTQKKFPEAEKEFRTALRIEPGNQETIYNMGQLLLAKGSPAEAISFLTRVRPQTVEARMNLVRAYLQAKRTAEALRLATNLSAENTSDVKLHFSLGVLLAAEKQFTPAQAELERADALQPGTPEILYNLGQTYYLNGDTAKAELVLGRALKLTPGSVETLFLLARIYTAKSRPLDALDLLVRANKITPDNPDILFLMAQISISQKFFADAIPLLEKASQIAPNRTDIRTALGESYFKADEVEKAIQTFNELIKIEPTVRDHAFLGLSYESLGRFDLARQSFQDALKLDPHDNFCLFHIGFIAEQQGDNASAEAFFQRVLKASPDFPYALLELAKMRIEAKRFPEAEELLKRYIRVSDNPATGYYKLAIVERDLHQTEEARRDLATFQTLSKSASPSANAYVHLFDYLDKRSQLAPAERNQQDLDEAIEQNKNHPGQADVLYPLAEAYLKAGKTSEARETIQQLDEITSQNSRLLAGTGVLLARYHLYDDAIGYFQKALALTPTSDEVSFDLANAYFRKGLYSNALDAAMKVSEAGRKDDAYLALLGDIYEHLGDNTRAEEIFKSAISRNPDNDGDYLALALLQFRENKLEDAKQTLLKGRDRTPGSGKILWGLGLAAALEGNTDEAAGQFEHAVDLLPEWPGSYSTLGVFYFQTGQIDKAKEVLDRFKNSNVGGGLDINKIDQVLSQAPATTPAPHEPMSAEDRARLLQLALFLADKTL